MYVEPLKIKDSWKFVSLLVVSVLLVQDYFIFQLRDCPLDRDFDFQFMLTQSFVSVIEIFQLVLDVQIISLFILRYFL